MTKMRVAVGLLAFAACSGEPVDDIGQFVGGTPPPAQLCDYSQAFGTPDNAGMACPEQTGLRVIRAIVQDPDAQAENDEIGFLQYHESPPLVSGDWVVIPSKRGFTTASDDLGFRPPTETWSIAISKWVPSVSAPNAALVDQRSVDTDWQPIDVIAGSFGTYTNGYVQQFGPAIVGSTAYVPASHGKISKVNLATGAVTTIDPFVGTAFDGDALLVVTSAVSHDSVGNVYYTAFAPPTSLDRSDDPRGSWLVHIRPDGTSRIAAWSTIATAGIGVPQRNDLCEYPFGTNSTPLGTGPDSRAPRFGCGLQRPALNAKVAIDRAGHLLAFSYANNAQGAAFLIQIDAATLAPIRAADTRGHLLYGCGVRLSGGFGDVGVTCNTITANGTVNKGFDPNFNGPVRFRGEDLMDSSPAIAPNGDWSIGSYDGGFSFGGQYDARGGGVIFDSTGNFKAKNESFFWEVTLSAGANGSFADENHYSDLELSTVRLAADQSVVATGAPPIDFSSIAIDFLDAHIPFGPRGEWYAVNGTGHLHKFGPDGALLESVALPNADGSTRQMETLSGYFARDRAGRIYASYAGVVYVIAGGGSTTSARTTERTPPTAAQIQAMRLKATRAAGSQLPSTPN